MSIASKSLIVAIALVVAAPAVAIGGYWLMGFGPQERVILCHVAPPEHDPITHAPDSKNWLPTQQAADDSWDAGRHFENNLHGPTDTIRFERFGYRHDFVPLTSVHTKTYKCGQEAWEAEQARGFTPRAKPPAIPHYGPGSPARWLAAHQNLDGSWDSDQYFQNNFGDCTGALDGAGWPHQDVRVTGLALLALIADGSTTRHGPNRDTVKRGIRWLIEQQDSATGYIVAWRLARSVHPDALLQHAIATLAITECYADSKNPFQKRAAQKAHNFLHGANPESADWPVQVEDWNIRHSELAAWMLLNKAAGKRAGIRTYTDQYAGLLDRLPELRGRLAASLQTDPSRITWSPDRFLPQHHMWTLVLLDQLLRDQPMFPEHLAAWEASMRNKAHATNPSMQYMDTLVALRAQGRIWSEHEARSVYSMIASLRTDGDYAGSHDPAATPPSVVGRIEATALKEMTVAILFRFSSLTGVDPPPDSQTRPDWLMLPKTNIPR